jgi:hypothetical protein
MAQAFKAQAGGSFAIGAFAQVWQEGLRLELVEVSLL